MSSQQKKNPNSHRGDIRIYDAIHGVDEFLNILEREFIAKTKIKCHYNGASNKAELILDLYFNFGLMESLRHFNDGDWGDNSFQQENEDRISSSFMQALETLNVQNSQIFDVVEASLHYQDTSIVISRIHDFSIPTHIGSILSSISGHFVYFTKGLTEVPYEVFVPVYEGKAETLYEPHKNTTHYFDYWGLYIEDSVDHKAMIYTVQDHQLHQDDLYLLE